MQMPAEIALAQDGAIMLKNVLDSDALREAKRLFGWSAAHPSSNAHSFEFDAEVPGQFFEDIDNLDSRARYQSFLTGSALAEQISAAWGGGPVWYLYEQIFLKQLGEVRRTPWHQDISYMPLSGDRLAVAWISLDPLSMQESLEFVRASHRGPVYAPVAFDHEDDTKAHPERIDMPPMPNIEAAREQWDILSWSVEPGDVVLFHPAMLHGGAPISPGRRRRTLALRFFGDDVSYSITTGANGRQIGVSGCFDVIADALQPGHPLRHPIFPQLL